MVERINPNQANPLEQPKTQETGTEGGFGRILDQALAGPQAGGPAGAGLPVQSPGAVSGLVFQPLTDQLSPVDETLGLLERLGSDLMDPQTTPRRMYSLIQKLDAQADKLTSEAQNLPLGSPERKIMDQAAVVAKVQVAKYHRGEFI